MIKNYVSITWRNMRQSPLYAFINIFSLAIGLASCMVIYLFIKDERSFEAFHTKKQNVYRLNEVQNFTGTNTQKVALSMPGMGPFILKEFPEVVNFTRFLCREKQLVMHGEKQFLLPNVAIVDSTFLDIFDFKVLIGDRLTALDEPNTMMITERTALKFFADADDAINNLLTYQGKELKITGILKNVPENSHMQFDALASMTTITSEDKGFNDRWGSNFLNTYLLLQPHADIGALEEKFPAFLRRHIDNPDINKYYVLFLQRLDQVHLDSKDIEHDYNNYRKFNGEYLDIFALVGAFILLIAGVNFMNLTTARSSHRWKEIGVRTTVGARKLQLFAQFIFESTVLAIFALLLAALLSLLFLPLVNSLIERELSLTLLFNDPISIVNIVCGTIALGILTGIYPALHLTAFSPARIMKGGNQGARGRSVFRSGLVVVQFGLALGMIVSTLIVAQQLSYIETKNLGFNKDQIMLVRMNREANDKMEILRTELKRSPLIRGVAASSQRLGENFHQSGFQIRLDTGIYRITPSNVYIDYEYLDVYGIQLHQGRNFSNDLPGDKDKAFIINESFAKELGVEDIVGTPAGHGWDHSDSLGTIVGVVKDFNFNSLHYKINTLAMAFHPGRYGEMSVKIDAAQPAEAISHVKKVWEEHISYPFDYSFLDTHFERLYTSDQQMVSVVTVMAALAILISCLGLFGLASITTQRKTKEIGIRKVLGATEGQITALLSRDFTALIVLSFLLATPVTYWLLVKWLENFAYRISINPLLFLAGGMIALTIAILTISYHTIRSARANPVKALRYE